MNFFTATTIASAFEPYDKYATGERWVSLYIGKIYGAMDGVVTIIRDSQDGQIREAYFSACSIAEAPDERNTMMLPPETLGSLDEILEYVESTVPPEVKSMMQLIETVNSLASGAQCGDPECGLCGGSDDESL